MKREDRRNVASVIEANTERLALSELAARGKSHVRVISGERAMQLIQAVVDETIAARAGEMAKGERDRIVEEAGRRFQHVSRMQAETEALVRQQKELLHRQDTQIKKLEKAYGDLKNQLLEERKVHAEREKTARLHAETLEGAQRHLKQAGERERQMAQAIKKLDHRLQNSRLTIENYDREIVRLAQQVKSDAELIGELEGQVRERELELQRIHGLMEALKGEVEAARAQQQQQPSTDPESIRELRGELSEMKTFLRSLEKRTGSHVPIEEMLERLSKKEETTKAELEDRFQERLDHTLEQIGKTLHAATAKPVDRRVEATDVFISKLFDEEHVMESNLPDLEVKVSTAKQSISKSLERLKELRGPSSPEEEPENEERA